jgi:dienelactone hydrolase
METKHDFKLHAGCRLKKLGGKESMEKIVIIITAIIEIAFGVYCLKTKSNQKRIRSIIRISAFTAFIIFTLVSVIQWGFRWIFLAMVLFIWAIIGGISLTRNKEDKKEYRAAPTVLKAMAMWLIVAFAMIPALIFPQYKLPEVTGKHKINTVVYTFKDTNRIDTFSPTGEKREVTVEFWYPEDTEGRYPLVVFSHGAFGVKTSNTSTFNELASNGYIVCSIDHPYQSLFTVSTDRKFTRLDKSFMQEVNGVNNGAYDDETEYKLEKKWLKVRTEDMNFVLDTIIKNTKEDNNDKVYSLIDTSKIGLIGHSLGGAASVQLGRERSDINAVINLDADLLGEYTAFNNGKFEVNQNIYPIPLLSIYSDDMKRLFEKVTDENIILPQKLISATAPKSFEIYFQGTNHMSLTDLPLSSPFLVRMLSGSAKGKIGTQEADKYYVIEKMNNTVLRFFNCYLKNEGNFHPEGKY